MKKKDWLLRKPKQRDFVSRLRKKRKDNVWRPRNLKDKGSKLKSRLELLRRLLTKKQELPQKRKLLDLPKNRL